MSFKTISSKLAAQLDKELMGSDVGFTLEQLMELAGFSVAQVVCKEFPRKPSQKNQVLVIAGPGNNGGDGLVCARHLKLFGYNPVVYYPKPTTKTAFYGQLVNQLKFFKVPVLGIDDDWSRYLTKADTLCIVDAIFGFSFKPPMRSPFDSILQKIKESQEEVPIVAVDIPSGWDVDAGPTDSTSITPKVLVSLTVPKPCANFIDEAKTAHYVGGRFIPQDFALKYGFEPFQYASTDQTLKL